MFMPIRWVRAAPQIRHTPGTVAFDCGAPDLVAAVRRDARAASMPCSTPSAAPALVARAGCWHRTARLPCRAPRPPFRDGVVTLLGWLKEGRLGPAIDQVLPLDKAWHAQKLLEDSHVSGKIVLQPQAVPNMVTLVKHTVVARAIVPPAGLCLGLPA